jgi:hypothetical protein
MSFHSPVKRWEKEQIKKLRKFIFDEEVKKTKEPIYAA